MNTGTQLYEALMSLGVDFDHAAEKMREGLDPDQNHGPADEIADEIAKVYEEAHGRIAVILNSSPLADVEGSASSQHYIETGFRLPVEVPDDAAAVDQIANILAAPSWSGADFLEAIADVIGTVRPHPGGYSTRDEYAAVFARVTGRNVIEGDD